MKIVKAYAIVKPSMDLHRVAEAGFLDSIKGGLGNMFANKPAAKTTTDTTHGASVQQDRPLEHIVSSIVNAPEGGFTRIVVYLNRVPLTDLYLTSNTDKHLQLARNILGVKEAYELLKIVEADDPNTTPSTSGGEAPSSPDDNPTGTVIGTPGAAKLAAKAAPKASAKKATPKAAATSGLTGRGAVRSFKPDFTFSSLLNDKYEDAVLINAPNGLLTAYVKAKSPEDKVQALARMFDRKYYVMTINNSAAKRIAPAMDKAKGDLTASLIAFNPNVVVEHPAKQTMKLARLEWNEKHSEHHKQAHAPAGAAHAPAPTTPAEPTPTPTPAEPEKATGHPWETSSAGGGENYGPRTKELKAAIEDAKSPQALMPHLKRLVAPYEKDDKILYKAVEKMASLLKVQHLRSS